MADRTQSAEPELAHFGKYLLDQEIARGGMSRVFRARLRGPGGFEKKLVVKQILPELARDPSFIELFVKEANTLVQMSHPNLVPVYELGVVDGVYFLAMEWVEGATVAELVQEGPLPAQLVAHVGEQIAQALRYAHERFQIVHRDVTPRNVIIDASGQARLLDFGIAAPAELTGKGEIFGSPGYMAPEQMRGEPLGPESDVFGLGAVLYEAACGRPAFPRKPPHAAQSGVSGTLAADTTLSTPVPLEGFDPELRELIMHMLSLERAARPSQAAQVATALRGWLARHHPQGVERELSERAMRAHELREVEPKRALEAAGSGASSGRVEVRSIATSPVLDELLKHATERIERVSPSPGAERAEAPPPTEPQADPELEQAVKRFTRDILVVALALAFAVWSASRMHQEEDDDASAPPTAAPAAHAMPPSAAGPVLPGSLLPGDMAGAGARPAQAARAATDSGQPQAHTTPDASAAAAKLGFVTVSATPWASVHIDGRDLGTTPRRKLPLRVGKHTLTLACPPLGTDARVPLELHAGQAVQVVVDMHESPPKVSVR